MSARTALGLSASRSAVALAVLVAVAAPHPDGPHASEVRHRCCGKQDDETAKAAAYAAFERGMQQYHSSAAMEGALGPLCHATCCWPRPDPQTEISFGIGSNYYQPSYWQGVFFLESKKHRDPCRALRYLNLARCEREKVKDRKKKLDSPEKRAREARRERVETPSDFYQGVDHFSRDKNWRAAADRMLQAIGTWDEDGEATRVQGRFRDTYLPRYVLARSLMELGCLRDAIGVMRCSEVSWCLLAELEKASPGTLLAEAERRLAASEPPEPAVCAELRERMEELDVDLDGCCACAGC